MTVKELNRFGRLMEARVENFNSYLNVLLSLSSEGRVNSVINTRHTVCLIIFFSRSNLNFFIVFKRFWNCLGGAFLVVFYPELFSLLAEPFWEHSWNFEELPTYVCAYTKIKKSNFNESKLLISFKWWLYSAIVFSYSNKNRIHRSWKSQNSRN